MAERTWDGLPIAADEPNGATVMVRRETRDGRQYLILHRAHHGPDYAGDWAWTPPSGARQPGESILAGALRELAEEADISPAEIWPVDLTGGWARFCVDVPADMPVRLVDVEHDRFAWVPPDEALRRCTPDAVSGGIRRAERIYPGRIGFRPLSRADLSLVLQWHSAAHAARWFGDGPRDVAAAEAKYGPRIDGVAPVRMNVIEIDGRPSGYAQHYPTRDHSEYATAARDLDAVAIDYLIGDADCVGRGLGPRMLWQYVREVVLPAHPTAPRIIASPDARNTRSIRALEKAGFQRGHLARTPGQDGPEQFCVLDRARVFGP